MFIELNLCAIRYAYSLYNIFEDGTRNSFLFIVKDISSIQWETPVHIYKSLYQLHYCDHGSHVFNDFPRSHFQVWLNVHVYHLHCQKTLQNSVDITTFLVPDFQAVPDYCIETFRAIIKRKTSLFITCGRYSRHCHVNISQSLLNSSLAVVVSKEKH